MFYKVKYLDLMFKMLTICGLKLKRVPKQNAKLLFNEPNNLLQILKRTHSVLTVSFRCYTSSFLLLHGTYK